MAELPFPDPPLRVDRILLRPWSNADVPAIVAACQDPAIARFIPHVPSPYTEADALEWLASQEPNRLSGRRLEMAIADAETDEVLGALAAGVNQNQRTASIGYWLAPTARGQGHTTTATRLWCRWLFEALELERIELVTDPENIASQRVAQRCGFQQEGRLRSHLRFPHTGIRRDSLIWGLLPDELPPR